MSIGVTAGRYPAGRQRGMALWMTLALAVFGLVVVGGGTAAGLWYAGIIGGEEQPADGEAGEKADAPKPPIYLPFEPALVVNIDRDGRSAYLQVDLQIMARDQAVIDAVNTHKPVVRNDVLLLLGNQAFSDIDTRAGKERLREKVRAEINAVLADKQVDGEVEAVYFTSFILQ